ncbi:phage minor capsid protein [Limosilactobacillus fermentum]|uniref:phage minor capsid protein n=1 Tax=Limosilactobacillus fermentum TaxID=1613 RepID=UPI0023B2649B|nr:phage minor capsid protein [Limosilactobacillus fermentum]
MRTINHSMIPDEAIKNGKLFQQQRARERAIRDAKKRLRVAEQLGDDQMVSQAKTLLRSRQAKPRDFGTSSKRPTGLRDFIKETNGTSGLHQRDQRRQEESDSGKGLF